MVLKITHTDRCMETMRFKTQLYEMLKKLLINCSQKMNGFHEKFFPLMTATYMAISGSYSHLLALRSKCQVHDPDWHTQLQLIMTNLPSEQSIFLTNATINLNLLSPVLWWSKHYFFNNIVNTFSTQGRKSCLAQNKRGRNSFHKPFVLFLGHCDLSRLGRWTLLTFIYIYCVKVLTLFY